MIASRVGALPEIVEDGVTGFLFEAGNATQLAKHLGTLLGNSGLSAAMSRACSNAYSERYSGQANYTRMMNIYTSALTRVSEPEPSVAAGVRQQ